VADQQALQAGIALARQQLGSAALSDVCRGEAAKALALQFDVGRLVPLGNQIGNLISADLQRIQQITAGFNAIRAMHPLLQAEEERRQRLAEIINPCRGLMEGLRIQSSGLDRVAESYQASWRRMAEAVVPRFPAIECGLGLDAISTIAPFGELGLADLQGPMRIHAVPRLAFPAKHRQARRHDQPSPPEQLQAGPTIDLTGEDSRKLLKQLLPFLRSDEIPGKTRESMSALIDWWQLNQQGITPDQSVKFNRIVLNLIHAQVGLASPEGEQRQLSSGVLVPLARNAAPPPDLAPEIFTTKELKQQLHASIDTLKRHARKACEKGPLPQPLSDFPDWFVVARSDPQGGQNRGWKFQKRLV
jgi:hypothetical protein